MKTLKFLSLALLAAASLGLTSCNDDNDSSYTPLTPAEKTQCFMTVRGEYTGKLIYTTGATNNGQVVSDTIDAAWSIQNDSTLTIKKFPARLLAVYITNADLKKALEEAPDQDLVCRTSYAQTSPVAMYLNPVTPAYNLTYGGATHKVQVPFYVNSTQSWAKYNSDKKRMTIQIVEGLVFVDSKKSDDLQTSSGFFLYGTKQ